MQAAILRPALSVLVFMAASGLAHAVKCDESNPVDSVAIQINTDKGAFSSKQIMVEIGSGNPFYRARPESQENPKQEWGFRLRRPILFTDLKNNIILKDSAIDPASMRSDVFKHNGLCGGIFSYGLVEKKTWSMDFKAVPAENKVTIIEPTLKINSTTDFQTGEFRSDVKPDFQIGISIVEKKEIFMPILFEEVRRRGKLVLTRSELRLLAESLAVGDAREKVIAQIRKNMARKNALKVDSLLVIMK